MSDDSSSEEEYVPFGQRENFKDVKPIVQEEGPDPVCPIAYTPQFTDTMNYLRAMLHANEKSARALEITKEAISVCPANYTIWQFRRQILDGLHADLNAELDYIAQTAKSNPKNYQIWYHRLSIVEKLNDGSKELSFIEDMLKIDEKNYHAWSYRQWVLKKFNLWEKELEFIEKLIGQDIRNNSAWNQRYFVIHHTTGLTKEIRKQEIEYAQSKISKAPNNESPWNYQSGMVKGMKFSDFPEIEAFCLDKKDKWPTCSHVLSTLVEIYEESQDKDKITQAIAFCETLLKGLDDIHKKYWVWKKLQLEKIVSK